MIDDMDLKYYRYCCWLPNEHDGTQGERNYRTLHTLLP